MFEEIVVKVVASVDGADGVIAAVGCRGLSTLVNTWCELLDMFFKEMVESQEFESWFVRER